MESDRRASEKNSVKFPLWAVSIAAFVLLAVLGVVGMFAVGY